MGGARLGREPAIGPALHLCYWPIQIETFFFIFYIACSCVGTNKTSMGQPGRLKLGAHFPATWGSRPYQPLWWRRPFLRVWLVVKNIPVALLIYPQNGWIACFYELSSPIMWRMPVFSSYCRLLRSRYAKSNRMKYTVKASVMCLATTSLTTRPHITYQGCTILPD